MLYNFLTTPDEVEKYVEIRQSNSLDNFVDRYNVEILNIFDPELQLINSKPTIKSKVQTIFVLDYKKRNGRKIFPSRAKLIQTLMKHFNPCMKALRQKLKIMPVKHGKQLLFIEDEQKNIFTM